MWFTCGILPPFGGLRFHCVGHSHFFRKTRVSYVWEVSHLSRVTFLVCGYLTPFRESRFVSRVGLSQFLCFRVVSVVCDLSTRPTCSCGLSVTVTADGYSRWFCVDSSHLVRKMRFPLVCDCHNFSENALSWLSVRYPRAPGAEVGRVGVLQLVEMPTWTVWLGHTFCVFLFLASCGTVADGKNSRWLRVDGSQLL